MSEKYTGRASSRQGLQAGEHEQNLRDSVMGREDISLAAFKAGFNAAWRECGELTGDYYEQRIQHAWKKYCGIDS